MHTVHVTLEEDSYVQLKYCGKLVLHKFPGMRIASAVSLILRNERTDLTRAYLKTENTTCSEKLLCLVRHF